MPRANRHYRPGHVWHLTHRCHRRQFLLRFARDRRTWENWLFAARQRLGLCVLNYTVTSNHVHLLVLDRGRGEIAASMQLVAGRTAQQFNRRKRRRGAFWDDRYHATAVETGEHLIRCLTYIDLNMVRAGVVPHPRDWPTGGYHEIQRPRLRKRIIDRAALAGLVGLSSESELAQAHQEWLAESLRNSPQRDPRWSEALAVGDRGFVEMVRLDLGRLASRRRIDQDDGSCLLHEPPGPFHGENSAISRIREPGFPGNINQTGVLRGSDPDH